MLRADGGLAILELGQRNRERRRDSEPEVVIIVALQQGWAQSLLDNKRATAISLGVELQTRIIFRLITVKEDLFSRYFELNLVMSL